MADNLLTLFVALAIVLVNLAMLVWIFVDTYRMWQFRRRLYAPVEVEKAASDEG